jgi:RNA polymerase sigma-B factor
MRANGGVTTSLDSQRAKSSRDERAQTTLVLVEALRSADTDERRAELREQLILTNIPVAESIAHRYAGRGIGTEDLVQVAAEGLVKAVTRFDPDRGIDLLSYAVPSIRGEVQRHFRDHGWTIRPSRWVQELQLRINHVLPDLRTRLAREPTELEITAELEVDLASYREAVSAFGLFQPTSIDKPLRSDSDLTMAALLVEGGRSALDVGEDRMLLAQALGRLTARDRQIVHLRFFEERTQDEIGRLIGLTQMQVSRLLRRIIADLRALIGEGDLEVA